MKRSIQILTIFILALSFYETSAQEFKKLIDDKEDDYLVIDSTLSSIKRDEAKLEDFLNASSKVNYLDGMIYAYNSIGIINRNRAEYPKAIEYHKKAIEFSEISENMDLHIISLNMLGVVYRRKDEVRLALDCHKQALELAERHPANTITRLKSLAISRNSIGNLYIVLKQEDLAEKEFLESIKIEEKLGNKLGLAINHQNLGSIYEERGEYDKALKSYYTSLDYNNQIDSDLGRVICHNSLGQIYLKQGKPEKALTLIEPSIAKAIEIGDTYYVSLAKENMGWALMDLGKYKEAESYINEGLKLAKDRGLQYFIAEGYKLLSKLNEKTGDYKKAFEYQRLFYENEEKYLNERNQQYVAELILKYDSEKKKSQIEILEKENELVSLKLADNRRFLIITLILASLLGVIFYILYRQSMLNKEKAFLALEQKMMRSQMNPHFIFNSLNSIKLYIINNDKDKAVYYLNKFSKLIRTILSNSKEKDISLEDELSTMELYMNIENIRFSNKINFGMEIEDGLKTKHVRIPSLILQPFLENSIWHGLSPKEGDKRLMLRVFKSSEKQLTIEIEDNGVGRTRSQEIKATKTLKNKSVGISITEERLDNYFKNVAGEHSLKIIDLYDENKVSCGTKVVLNLPLAA